MSAQGEQCDVTFFQTTYRQCVAKLNVTAKIWWQIEHSSTFAKDLLNLKKKQNESVKNYYASAACLCSIIVRQRAER